jgi:hypothetical protein
VVHVSAGFLSFLIQVLERSTLGRFYYGYWGVYFFSLANECLFGAYEIRGWGFVVPQDILIRYFLDSRSPRSGEVAVGVATSISTNKSQVEIKV